MKRLRLYNVAMGGVHAAQSAVVLALANTFALPVTASYLTGPPGTQPGPPTQLFEVRVAWVVAAFLALSAIAHWVIAGPAFPRYIKDLSSNRNIARWIEYSLSSSLMIIIICQLCGISDIAALLAIAGVNASMIFFGWLQERYEEPGNGQWLPFIFGCITGIVPWIGVAIYALTPGSNTGASPPAFVYGIIVSLFVFFNVFALNQWLQYKRIGPWRNYLYGEGVYIFLSLTAKSALAWQIFAASLTGTN